MKLFDYDYVCLVGDGRQGYPNRGPYDAIHVGAAAKEMPQPVRLIAELFSDTDCQNVFFCFTVDRPVGPWWTFNSTDGSREFGSNLSANRQDSGWQNQAATSNKRGICPAD